jgi:hypothetical protein
MKPILFSRFDGSNNKWHAKLVMEIYRNISLYAETSVKFVHKSTAIRESYLSIYSSCSYLEHRASVKRFVSLQFLNLYTVSRTPWTEISPMQGRYLHTEQHKHRINAHRHSCL